MTINSVCTASDGNVPTARYEQ